jgi:hypothetical protein
MRKSSRSGVGRTGPRTPQGKARSAQNASKHKILVGRILPEEKKQALFFYEAFQRELQPKGVLESEIVDDIVLNRLQKHRIDKCITNEFQKTSTRNTDSWIEDRERRMSEYWVRSSSARNRSRGQRLDRLPPEVCVVALEGLKANVQQKGVQPDEDLSTLGLLYGTQPTEMSAMVALFYQQLQSTEYQSDEERKAKYKECQEEVIPALTTEIDRQKLRAQLSCDLDETERSDVPVLPTVPALDTILRYNSTNSREFTHLLDALERVRRLQK